MTVKDFTPHSGTEVFYKSATAYTSNYNQKLTDIFIHKIIIFKIRCQQNICYTQEHIIEQINYHQNSVLNYQIRDIVWLNTQNIHND